MLVNSVEFIPSVFDANPIKSVQRIWEIPNYAPVVKGLVVGVMLSLAGFLAASHISDMYPNRLAPSAAALFLSIIVGLFLPFYFASNNVTVRVQTEVMDLGVCEGFTIIPYLPDGFF